jgi:hypothetical protein
MRKTVRETRRDIKMRERERESRDRKVSEKVRE